VDKPEFYEEHCNLPISPGMGKVLQWK